MAASVLVLPATAGLDSIQTTPAPSTTPAPVEMSRECYNEVWENVFNDRKEPSGALRDVISSKDLFLSANMPTSECDLLSKIPPHSTRSISRSSRNGLNGGSPTGPPQVQACKKHLRPKGWHPRRTMAAGGVLAAAAAGAYAAAVVV
ncbi:hypothetical protein PG990_003107 [Apiospora arundinis]